MSIPSTSLINKAEKRPALSVHNVSKSFRPGTGDSFVAVKDISFSVAPGEIVALVGPSGSGKTTLLNMIAGLLAPDAGQIEIFGQSGQDVDWHRVGYMFQDDRLLPWRTALDNVSLALEALPMARAERRERSAAVLEAVGLRAFTNSYPHELSGGMRSRVALARSLVTRPDILLMDEPFGRLDAQTRAAMHEQLLEIHQARGITILLVTHDVEEAIILAERVVMFSARPGKIERIVDVGIARPRVGNMKAAALINELRAAVSGTVMENGKL